jgi:hypothetical protein
MERAMDTSYRLVSAGSGSYVFRQAEQFPKIDISFITYRL